jgi:hypothetical protein
MAGPSPTLFWANSTTGRINVQMQYGDVTKHSNLYLFDDDVDAVCGRQWLAKLRKNQYTVNSVKIGDVTFQQQRIVDTIFPIFRFFDFSDLFTDNLGVVPNYKVSFKMAANAKPIYLKPRSVPYALKGQSGCNS